MNDLKLYHGDCLEVMDKLIEQNITVDAIITDPPYGTTACKWDSVIPFDEMWKRLNKLIKPDGAIVLFSSQPFTSALIMSNPKMFRYEWVWQKNRGSNFAQLKYQPFKEHENIVVFSKNTHKYYPIKQERSESGKSRANYSFKNTGGGESTGYIIKDNGERRNIDKDLRMPSSIQKFNTEVGLHPTQKPVSLLEYLIKTYTNENETVLDFTFGSCSTGIACLNTNRNFIGIELDDTYFKLGQERLINHVKSISDNL